MYSKYGVLTLIVKSNMNSLYKLIFPSRIKRDKHTIGPGPDETPLSRY